MSNLLKKIQYNNLTNWSISHLLSSHFNYNKDYKLVRLGDFLRRSKTQILVDDNTIYKRVTIRLFNKGVKLRNTEIGKNIGTKKQYVISKGQFLLSKIDARNGAFGIATDEIDNAIITADFFAYDVDDTQIIPEFLVLLTTTKQFQKFAQSASTGTTGRQRIVEKKFLDVMIPLPSLMKQKEIIRIIISNIKEQKLLDDKYSKLIDDFIKILFVEPLIKNSSIMEFIRYRELDRWSVKGLISNVFNYNSEYDLCKIGHFLKREKTKIKITDEILYKRVKIRLYNKGVCMRDEEFGKYIKTKQQYIIEKDQFLLSKIDARNGAFGIAKEDVDKAIITADFLAYDIDNNIIDSTFFLLLISTEQFLKFAQSASSGTTGRQRINEDLFLQNKIPLPSIKIQKKLVEEIELNMSAQKKVKELELIAIEEFEKHIFNEA